MTTRRLSPFRAILGAAVACAIAGGAYVGVTQHDRHAASVLGEKIVGSGSSAGSEQSGANAKGNGNGNGNTSNPPSKTFTITGTVGGLYPGATVQLQLTTTNKLNQDMTVRQLSASFTNVTKATGQLGNCSPTVTIGSWTGTAFLLPKGSTVVAPGYIPVSIGRSTPDACQGATFNLHYSGTAVGQ